jgi:hypothetical protein
MIFPNQLLLLLLLLFHRRLLILDTMAMPGGTPLPDPALSTSTAPASFFFILRSNPAHQNDRLLTDL